MPKISQWFTRFGEYRTRAIAILRDDQGNFQDPTAFISAPTDEEITSDANEVATPAENKKIISKEDQATVAEYMRLEAIIVGLAQNAWDWRKANPDVSATPPATGLDQMLFFDTLGEDEETMKAVYHLIVEGRLSSKLFDLKAGDKALYANGVRHGDGIAEKDRLINEVQKLAQALFIENDTQIGGVGATLARIHEYRSRAADILRDGDGFKDSDTFMNAKESREEDKKVVAEYLRMQTEMHQKTESGMDAAIFEDTTDRENYEGVMLGEALSDAVFKGTEVPNDVRTRESDRDVMAD